MVPLYGKVRVVPNCQAFFFLEKNGLPFEYFIIRPQKPCGVSRQKNGAPRQCARFFLVLKWMWWMRVDTRVVTKCIFEHLSSAIPEV